MEREESDEREQLLHSLKDKTEQRQKLAAELEKYKACDPDRMKELRKHIYSHIPMYVCLAYNFW